MSEIRPDAHGVWSYYTQPNGEVWGYDFGPNVIMVDGKRVRWGYMLRGDFEPMRSMSPAVLDWVRGLPSQQKEFLCDIIQHLQSPPEKNG